MSWRLRNRLSTRGRRIARVAADRTLRPVGSLHRVATEAPYVAVTFDDGPDPEHTPDVITALDRARATATFFVLLDRAHQHSSLVGDICSAGHELALHGPTHDRVTRRPIGALARVLRNARYALEDAHGVPVRWYRPPFGAQSLRSYLAARAAGLDVVVWSSDARDWLPRPLPDIAADAARTSTPGRILLLHDGLVSDPANPTPPTSFARGAMTEAVLAALARRGLSGTTVSDLLQFGKPERTAWFRP